LTKTNYLGTDTIMISKFKQWTCMDLWNQFNFEALFRYTDSLSLSETPYWQEDHWCRKMLLFENLFFHWFLAKNWCASCSFTVFNGLVSLVKPLSLYVFPRSEVVSGTEIFCFHTQLLKDLEVRYPKIVRIDSTVLRSRSLHLQAKCEVSTQYYSCTHVPWKSLHLIFWQQQIEVM
jgi:hypothetical protein